MDIVSSGDNGNLQHSNSISNKIHIGDYTSPRGEKMSFFYFSNKEPPIWVQLNVGNTETLIPLWIPELNINRNRDFVLPTVRRYLKDTYLRPEYCRLDKQVRFFAVHPKDKHRDWILEDHSLSLPSKSTMPAPFMKRGYINLGKHAPFVYQSNGCVSYVINKKEIMTWNYKDGKKSSIMKSLITITALTEQNGSLIVGCEDGHFYLLNFGWICPKKSPVVEIVTIGSTHLAVRYRDESVIIFISKNGVSTAPTFDQISRIWSVGDRFLVMLQGKTALLFFDINTNGILDKKIFSSELEYDNIYVVSDTICVATNEDISIWEEGTSWHTLTKEDFFNFWKTHEGAICNNKDCSQCPYGKSTIEASKETSWTDLIKSIKEKTFVFLPSGVFIFPQLPIVDTVCVTYFPIFANPSKRPKTFHVDGNASVSSMILLSGGSSIMYASESCVPRLPSIHVITTEGERIFSKYEVLNINQRIVSFKEMMDGSVATLCYDMFDDDEYFIRVITPRYILSENSINQVNEFRSNLTSESDPSSLDLYQELARKFLLTDYCNVLDHHSAYHTYLDGLEAAAEAKNLYRAIRFYEKAKNIFPDRDEPMRLFLLYREQFPNCKIERNIQFDPLELLKNKKCKLRLFVGEGDFSYTESLIKKHIHTHKQLSQSVVATELLNLQQMNDSEIYRRIERLRGYKVTVLTGIDGQEIHKHPKLKDLKFKRIHWNCPLKPDDRESFRNVIPNFFRSCEKIQSTGDRIHVTLMQGWKDGEWHERRQYENPIVKGSVESCYRLIRKRNFGKARYPEYNHKKATGDKISVPGVHREFVFEKVSSSMYSEEVTEDKIKNSLPINNPHKKYFIKVNKRGGVSREIKPEDCYFECNTDEDSSDYYSDSDFI